MKAKKYIISCPSVFIDLEVYEDDLEALEDAVENSTNGILSWRKNEVFIGFTRDGGDGNFTTSEGYEVGVEHGMVGVFPDTMFDIEERPYLRTVELELADCSVEDGVFKLGHITIDTGALPDQDEIEDDEIETVEFLEEVREDRETLKLLNREQLIRFIEFAVQPRNDYDDFSGVDLEGADLGDADFTGANLRGANLKGVSFKGAEIFQVDFTGADLTGADFSGVDIDGVIFDRAILIDANFEDAVEYDEGASFEGAIFEEISSDPSPEMEALLSQVECAFWTTVINAYPEASVPEIDSCTQKEVQEVMRKAILSFLQQNS